MSSFHLIKLFDYAFLVVISSDLTYLFLLLNFLLFQYNRLHYSFQVPSWIFCKLGGNDEDIYKDEMDKSFVEVNVSNMAIDSAHGNHSWNGKVPMPFVFKDVTYHVNFLCYEIDP